MRHPKRIAKERATTPAPVGLPHLAQSPIARVPAGTFGPYLGMRADGGLSLWASENSGRQNWFARPLSERGEASGEALHLGEAPTQLGLVTVRPTALGFALLSSHRVSDGELVELQLLSSTGARLFGPTTIAHSESSVLWVEVIGNAHGSSALWATSRAGKADIWLAQASEKAELVANPKLLARDAGAWQAVALADHIALAVTHVGKGRMHGPIEVSLIDGTELAPATVVNAEISADLDLDMAAIGDHVVLAWSDHRGGENRVFSAAVDKNGKLIEKALPATPPLGEQAVLRVVPPVEGSLRGYLAWESLDLQTATYRTFQIAEFQANGRVTSPRGLFEYWKMDGSMPEIAASARGVAVLTLAPICALGQTCRPDAPVAPEFLEFDEKFAILASEPLSPPSSSTPLNLAWNLTCPNRACFALSAESGVPSNVMLTRLERLTGAYRVPAQRVELPPPPRIVADEALADTAPLFQIAVTETSAGSLLGWITDFDPTTPWVKLKSKASDGRFEPLRARLDLQAFFGTAPYAALAAAENLSLRAHSLGGISLSGGAQQKETLVGWAGLDGGQPQVFLTLLDKAGKRTSQRMLTHKNGDLSDVSVAPSGNDFLVAWVDERSSDPELYATKVNRGLNRIAAEQRITQAPGAATDVSLVPTAAGALAVWADARSSETAGSADIYATLLRGSDATRAQNELCLQRTRTHSFAPVARALGTGALVAWLEAAAEDADGEAAHVSFAVLDSQGALVGAVQSLVLGASAPVTLAMDCSNDVCHVIVGADENAHSALYAFTVRDAKASTPVRIRSNTDVAPSRVAPVLRGHDLYVSEVRQGRARLRRLELEW